MSWRDNLQPASFRGVQFHYEDVDRSFGRRVKTHEYPGGNEPYHEDLGARTETISITAYVLGTDHLNKASALRDAINKPGPGTLVHPFYGEIQAVALETSERFSTREGGIARFSLRFERAGPNRNPSARVDTTSLVATRAAAINTTAASDFALNFSVEGSPGWVDTAAQDDLGTVLDDVAVSASDAITAAGDLADLAFSINDMRQTAATLVRDPLVLATRLSTTMQNATDLPPLLKMASTTLQLSTIAATTPSRLIQSNNRKAMVDLLNNIALSSAMRSVPTTSFETASDAYNARDEIAVQVDRLSLTSSNDMARALSSGLASVTRHISATAPSLPRLLSIAPTMTRPTLAHAYDLYGDDVSQVITRAGQLATRNRIRHPGFVPAGDTLEVLGNG